MAHNHWCPDFTVRTLLNMLAAGLRHWTFTRRPLDPGGVLPWLGDGCTFGPPRFVAGAGSSQESRVVDGR